MGRKLKEGNKRVLRFDIPPKNKQQRGVALCSISLSFIVCGRSNDFIGFNEDIPRELVRLCRFPISRKVLQHLLAEEATIEVRVNLGSADVFVSQHHLDGTQRSPTL